jgi:hypothetical protein
MIYNSRKYPLLLFIEKKNNKFKKGHYVIYKMNKCLYMGKVFSNHLNGIVINTQWEFAETIENISIEQIIYISKLKY